ncbi:MAG TPA: hypothetical protein VMV33_04840 [Rhodocyclaceae bacterium]|nr:hypothetical protein [Rhodocyclaceae bacterium]
MIVATTARLRLMLQLLATLAVLAWLPGNAFKLFAFLVIWALGFGRITGPELLLMLGINALFVLMNLGALHQGVFRFNRPDALGMPMYEFAMWGFYILNALRFLGGRPPRGRSWVALGLAAMFALPFSTVGDATALTLVSAAILALCLAFYHERMDLAYVLYMVVMGAMVEYIGVATGQWTYPGTGGVPLWFATMWGGVGLFSRRLLLPLLYRDGVLGAAR